MSTSIQVVYPSKTVKETRAGAFVVHKNDGSIVTWPSLQTTLSTFNEVKSDLKTEVNQIFTTSIAWAALKNDGSVVTWGGNGRGGDSRSVSELLSGNVIDISATDSSFAALKNDGSVVAWGLAYNLTYDHSTKWDLNSLLDKEVSTIVSSSNSFAALKNDNTAIFFGRFHQTDDSLNKPPDIEIIGTNVKKIIPNSKDFAMIHNDGSASFYRSKDSTSKYIYAYEEVKDKLKNGVINIFPGHNSFVAIKDNGEVISWGDIEPPHVYEGTENLNGNNIEHIYSTYGAFAALNKDGTVIPWGHAIRKKRESYETEEQYNNFYYSRGTYRYLPPDNLINIVSIVATGSYARHSERQAFAGLTSDGKVLTWGDTEKGDTGEIGSILLETDNQIATNKRDENDKNLIRGPLKDVKKIVSSQYGFAALKTDGSIVEWGAKQHNNTSTHQSQLKSNFTEIESTDTAFAGIKADGSIYSWGSGSHNNMLNATGDITGGVERFVTPHTNQWEFFDPKVVNQNNASTSFDLTSDTNNTTNDPEETNGSLNNENISNQADPTQSVIYPGKFNDYKFINRKSLSLEVLGIPNGVFELRVKNTNLGSGDNFIGKALWQYTDNAPGNLAFSDKTIHISELKDTFDAVTGLNTDSGEMFRLYNAAFARFPDADGLKYWIDQFSSGRNSRRVVAQSFLGSEEFIEKYGSNVSDETYVNNLYKNVLGRDADIEGLNYWVGNLSSGVETRYEALLGFAESAENKALFTEMTGFA